MKKESCMRFLLMGFLLVFLTSAGANQVYRWTDANGHVHYSTTPPKGQAEKILMRSPKAVSNDGKSEDARAQMRKRLLESYDHERELKKKDRDKVLAAKKLKKLRCKQLTRQWKNLHYYGPIYYQNKVGGREFLNEEQRQEQKDDMKKVLRKYCGKVPSV